MAEGDVLKPKGVAATSRIGAGMLAGATEEEETNLDHVGNGKFEGEVGASGCRVAIADQAEWNGFDPGRFRVFIPPCLKLLAKSVVDFPRGYQSRVLGPHAGHHLADRS